MVPVRLMVRVVIGGGGGGGGVVPMCMEHRSKHGSLEFFRG